MSDTPAQERASAPAHGVSGAPTRNASSATPTLSQRAADLPTDNSLRSSLRTELMQWAAGSRNSEAVRTSTTALRSTPERAVVEQRSANGSIEMTTVPVYRAYRPPQPTTMEWLRQKALDVCDSAASFCKSTLGLPATQVDAISTRVVGLVHRVLGRPEGDEAKTAQRKENPASRDTSPNPFFITASDPAPIATWSKSAEFLATTVTSSVAAAAAAKALETVTNAVVALVEAVRSAERKQKETHLKEVEIHRKEIEQAIEKLKSLDVGPANPLLQQLIAAISSDFAPMDPNTAAEILRLAEINEQLLEAQRALRESLPPTPHQHQGPV